MGGSSSKKEYNHENAILENKLSNDLLEHTKCVYMTHDEYTKKVHIPNNMLHIETEIDMMKQNINFESNQKDIFNLLGSTFPIYHINENELILKTKTPKNNPEKPPNPFSFGPSMMQLMKSVKKMLNPEISEEIKYIIANLAKKYGKLVLPVYIMYARKFEYDGLLIDEHLEDAINKHPDLSENNKNILKNELLKKDNKDSLLARYKFKGKMYVNIYIPNMNKDGKLFTSIRGFKNNNLWMKSLILDDDLLFSIYPIYHMDPLIESNKKLKQIFEELKFKEYHFKSDQQNTCYSHGCVTEKGENVDVLIPTYSSNTVIMDSNIKSNSPYVPTKCLKPYNYNSSDNKKKSGFQEDLDDVYKKMTYQIFYGKDNAKKGKNACLQEFIEKMDLYDGTQNIMNIVDSCGLKYIIDKYRDDEGNYTTWNNKILKELAQRKNTVPGIQELVFPIFKLKPWNNDMFFSMPWGNDLMSYNYGMTEGDEIIYEDEPQKPNMGFLNFLFGNKLNNTEDEKIIYNAIVSANNEYWIQLDKYGKLAMYYRQKPIFWFNNRNLGKDVVLTFEDGKLMINNKNKKPLESITLVSKPYKEPLSLIIENTGQIKVFQNGFQDILDKKFKIRYNFALDMHYKNKGNIDGKTYDEYMKEKREREERERIEREGLYKYNKDITRMIERMLNIEKKYHQLYI